MTNKPVAPTRTTTSGARRRSNRAQIVGLLAAMAALLGYCGWIVVGWDGIAWSVIGGAIGLFLVRRVLADMFLKAMRARPLLPSQAPGAEAFVAALSRRAGVIACLIVDYHMLGLNGLEVLSELRRRGSHVPTIIMITATTDPMVERRATELGIKQVLKNPYPTGCCSALSGGSWHNPRSVKPSAPAQRASTLCVGAAGWTNRGIGCFLHAPSANN